MNQVNSRTNKISYRNIKVLRVLACLGVFVCHLVPLMGIGGAGAGPIETLAAKAANFGASGVYLFFVISGFLACHSASVKKTKTGSYYKNRALRILPQYYLVVLYEFLFHTLITHNATPDPSGLRWLRYIFMTSAVIPAPDTFWGNLALTWTVPLFAVFYLCAPLFLWITGVGADNAGSREVRGDAAGADAAMADKDKEVLGTKSCLKRGGFMTGISSGLVKTALLYAAVMAAKYIWLMIGPAGSLGGLFYMHYFILGMLAWQVVQAMKEPESRIKNFVFFIIVIGILCVFLKLAVGTLDYFTVVSWFYAALIILTSTVSRGNRKPAPGFAGWRIVDVLDRYSYDIYLVHGVVFEALTLVKPRLPLEGVLMAAFIFIAMIGLTAVGAFLMHTVCGRIVEKLR